MKYVSIEYQKQLDHLAETLTTPVEEPQLNSYAEGDYARLVRIVGVSIVQHCALQCDFDVCWRQNRCFKYDESL